MTSRSTTGPRPGFNGQAALRHAAGPNWVLTEPLEYIDGRGVAWVVPAGATTDLASVPRPAAWVVPRTGRSVSPAILHDHLWRQLVPAGVLGYAAADRTLREALLSCGEPLVLAWLMWAAVRWGSLLTRHGGSIGWGRDAPAVLAVTVLALPVVLPPALLCAVALVVFALADAVLAVAGGRTSRIGAFSFRS